MKQYDQLAWPGRELLLHWILQVQVKKSLLSRAACDTYLAQRCPAAGPGKQTDGKGPYRPLHTAPHIPWCSV